MLAGLGQREGSETTSSPGSVSLTISHSSCVTGSGDEEDEKQL